MSVYQQCYVFNCIKRDLITHGSLGHMYTDIIRGFPLVICSPEADVNMRYKQRPETQIEVEHRETNSPSMDECENNLQVSNYPQP